MDPNQSRQPYIADNNHYEPLPPQNGQPYNHLYNNLAFPQPQYDQNRYGQQYQYPDLPRNDSSGYYPPPQNPMIVPEMPSQHQHIVYVLPEFIDGLPTRPRGRKPEPFYCVTCKGQKTSVINYETGRGSWVWFGVCFVVCFPLACCPFCVEDCQDAIHVCPQCKREVGRDNFC